MTVNHIAAFEHCFFDGLAVDVVIWRRCRLLESGFGVHLSQQLASMPAVDLHALLELVDCGCSPELAARILSPVGAEPCDAEPPGSVPLVAPRTPAGSP